MKIHVITHGDPSVGIEAETITVDWRCLEFALKHNPEWREQVQKELTDAFSTLLDELVDIFFEDECPRCREVVGVGNLNHDCSYQDVCCDCGRGENSCICP